MMSETDVRDTLEQCLAEDRLDPFALHFARFVARHSGAEGDGLLVLSAALVAQRNLQGDVCVHLGELSGDCLFPAPEGGADGGPLGPPLDEWLAALRAAPGTVGGPGDFRPLTLDGERLYLHRLWRDERLVADAILARLAEPLAAVQEAVDPEVEGVDWQTVAAVLAASRRFAVISGGPGTGKTTTVIRVLRLLLQQQASMRIALAAPTGKAAARMVESIRQRKQELSIDPALAACIPDAASTLHRLLGVRPGGHFRHDRDNPLPIDCLVIDEASMIDLGLMARVLDALPPEARLILLGDRDQLASVDAGNVLGDITGQGQRLRYTEATAAALESATGLPAGSLDAEPSAPPIADAIGLLRTSYRFSDAGGIGRLSRLVNTGQAGEVLRLCREETTAGGAVHWLETTRDGLLQEGLDRALEGYRHFLECDGIEAALAAFERFRVLCARQRGELGVETINRRIGAALVAVGLIEGGEAYRGQPVLITTNDYELQLFNGDTGLIWPDARGRLRAWFRQADDTLRDVAVASLPQHVTAWAMTVHKSQGSEFEQVLLVLPADSNSALLSRELLYTGITRARERVVLHGGEAALRAGCQRRVRRSSGLAAALGWPSDASHSRQAVP
ncbi:MAG: exodeoxyribonuclease V subunit alpha [Pseudohongiellaceae bacterium]